MFQSNQVVPQALRSINSATFTGSYQAVGTAFTYPVRLMKIVNNSSVAITVSFDGGTTDHDFIPTGTFTLYDFGTNKGASASALDFPQGTQVMVKGSAGTGSVYLTTFSAFTPNQTLPLNL